MTVPPDSLSAILDLLPDPVFVADPESREVLFVNAAAVNLFGTTAKGCWHTLPFGAVAPCPHCEAAAAGFGTPGGPRSWQGRSHVTGRLHLVREQLISWNGRPAELAILIGEKEAADHGRQGYTAELESLLRISTDLTSTTDLKILRRKTVELSRALLGLDFSTLMVLSPDKSRLVIEETMGFPAGTIGTFALVKGQGLSTYVVQEKRPATVLDFQAEARFEVPPIVFEKNIVSSICTPMMIEEEVFGVLIGHTLARREFPPEEIQLFQTLGNQAAVALKNGMHLQSLAVSEQKFREIFNSSGDAIFISGLDWGLLKVNQVACEQLGYKLEELRARGFAGIEAAEVPHPAAVRLVKLQAEGRTYFETVFIRKDGSRLPVELNCRLIDFDSRPAILCVARDMTERKRAEQALAAEKERLLVTLRSIGDGVITTDTEGRISLINRVAEELTGWPQQEAAGRPLTEVFRIINERTRAICANPVEKVLKTGEMVDLANHTALVARDGRERLLEDSAAPIKNQDGLVIGVVLVFRDVTEKKRTESELLRIEKLESVGLLAGGIAHDFNNLLTAILGNVSLARTLTDREARIYPALVDAEKAGRRARDLTQQLLTFARGGSPVRKAAAIPELVRESCEFVVRGSAVRCAYDFAENLLPVEIDQGQISQVFNNFLINAMQAMPRGGTVSIGAGNVELAAGEIPSLPAGAYIRIEVADEGVGIPPGHLDRIFEPYFTTKQKGSGLGLASCYSIISNHGGHLGVRSQLGQGSTFIIHLPVSETGKPAAEPPRAPEALAGLGRVLVMDDEEVVGRVALRLLGHLGYQGTLAPDGAAAIAMYRQAREEGAPFAAVLMDLTVPGGMGGREATARILEIDPEARVIVSSGYSNDPVMADYRRYGFVEVAAKPYEIESLGRVFRTALGKVDF